MAIYAISDLHLSLSIDKPMDVFGGRWTNYMERLKQEWEAVVSPEDWVIIPGDISWATYLEQAAADFQFIQGLPGMKIISKGNHDYWWTTMKKLEHFLQQQDLSTIRFMHNNHFYMEGTAVCGTRGWKLPGDEGFDAEDAKIHARELQRLELSLKSIPEEQRSEILVAMHYPPINTRGEVSEFSGIMGKYGVKTCLYGHLHGDSCRNAVEGLVDGIRYRLISSDFLNFRPIRLE